MQLNRREFCCFAMGARTLVAQSAPPLIDRGFARVSKLSDHVYATIANPYKGLQALSNGGVICGRDRVLLVEGHFRSAGAELEIEAARSISKAAIVGAVNTHYHFDHTFGNQAYADRRIPIIAHESALRLMKERYFALKAVDKARLMAPLKARIADETDLEQRKRLQGDLEFDRLMYSGIDAATITYPTELLRSDQATKRIDLGGIAVILESHPGHTPTDLIVRIPDRDIVFTGDLLFYRSYPVCFDADMIAWRNILKMFLGYGAQALFIPGHGQVCGIEIVREQIDLIDDLHGYAEKMKRAGIEIDEASRRYTIPPRFREFDSSGWSAGIGAAIANYYR